MSYTAEGRIMGTLSGRIRATFFLPITGAEINFIGNFLSPKEGFSSSKATIKYNDLRQLTAAREFTGRLSENKIKLNLANGPLIEGVLDIPADFVSRLDGKGIWIIADED